MNAFFSVTATIFFLVNGQPTTEPAKLYNPAKFETMEACDKWMHGKDFDPVADALMKMVTKQYGSGIMFMTECEEHSPNEGPRLETPSK